MPRLTTTLFLLIATSVAVVGLSAKPDSESSQISVSNPRPIQALADKLVTLYGTPISYEEPIVEFPGDLRDVTEEVRRSVPRNPRDRSRKVRVPIGASLSLHVPSEKLLGSSEVRLLLQQLVDRQKANAFGPQFRVGSSSNHLHLLPSQSRNIVGEWVNRKSPLDSRIALPNVSRTFDEALAAFCDSVSAASGVRVTYVGDFGGVVDEPFTYGANQELARDALIQILATQEQLLTWSLNYSADFGQYYLNIKPVPIRSVP
jgi:hypothetical protein